MNKRKKALLIYGLVIFIALMSIMFFIPDSAFLKIYDKNIKKVKNTNSTTNTEVKFVDYDTQKERILKKQFKYEYVLLDSLSDKSYKYKCSGTINKEVESGTCTEPETISYTEKTKKDSFKINTNYVDVTYLLNYIKDYEPEITTYNKTREFLYKTNLEKLDTDITIYTDLENITKIEISNEYMTYILKYDDISY